MAKTFRYQFGLIAIRSRQLQTPRRRPPAVLGKRWTRTTVKPKPPLGLAAVKHAQHRHRHQQQNPEPQRPGRRGMSDKNEFYLYCQRTGQLYLFFALYPGG